MKILTLLITVLLTSSVYSQNDTVNIFALPELKIKQKVKGELITYLFENRLNKIILTPEKLLPDTNRYKYKAALKDIKYIYIHNGSDFWNVAAVSGLVGFALGFLWGGFFDFDPHPKFYIDRAFFGGFILGVPLALIGGAVGLLFKHYDEYELYMLNDTQKYEALKRIFHKYSIKPNK